jgi:hypothetical protein
VSRDGKASKQQQKFRKRKTGKPKHLSFGDELSSLARPPSSTHSTRGMSCLTFLLRTAASPPPSELGMFQKGSLRPGNGMDRLQSSDDKSLGFITSKSHPCLPCTCNLAPNEAPDCPGSRRSSAPALLPSSWEKNNVKSSSPTPGESLWNCPSGASQTWKCRNIMPERYARPSSPSREPARASLTLRGMEAMECFLLGLLGENNLSATLRYATPSFRGVECRPRVNAR